MQLVRQCTAQILAIEGILMRQTGARKSCAAIKRLSAEQVEAFAFAPDVALAVQANRAVSAVLQQQIAVLEQRLKERVSLRPEYRLLRTVPGIGEVLATTIMLEAGPVSRFAAVGNFASYCRCVDTLRESNGKKKGEGKATATSTWPGRLWRRPTSRCATARRPRASRAQEAQDQRRGGDQGAGTQTGARLLPHPARTEAVRCESMLCVTVWPRAASQETGLVHNPRQ